MGVLGRLFSRDPLSARKPFNLTTFLILTVVTLVIVQALGLLFGNALGFTVALGPIFIIMVVAAASLLAFALVKKLLTNTMVTKSDVFAVIIVAMLALMAMFFLEEFVPQLFSVQINELQSILGI